MSTPELPPLEQARENVAARFTHAYHKRAILAGAWDGGALIRQERHRIEGNTETTGGNDESIPV